MERYHTDQQRAEAWAAVMDDMKKDCDRLLAIADQLRDLRESITNNRARVHTLTYRELHGDKA